MTSSRKQAGKRIVGGRIGGRQGCRIQLRSVSHEVRSGRVTALTMVRRRCNRLLVAVDLVKVKESLDLFQKVKT